MLVEVFHTIEPRNTRESWEYRQFSTPEGCESGSIRGIESRNTASTHSVLTVFAVLNPEILRVHEVPAVFFLQNNPSMFCSRVLGSSGHVRLPSVDPGLTHVRQPAGAMDINTLHFTFHISSKLSRFVEERLFVGASKQRTSESIVSTVYPLAMLQ